LNQKAAVTVLVTFLVISVCLTAVAAADRPYFLVDTQHIGNLREAAASVPIVVGASLHGAQNPLDQPTRMQIYNYIKDNSGVHFRGICDGLGLSVGVVQYHLDVLEHAGLIVAFRDGQNKRYFDHGAIAKTDAQLVSLMRHDTTAKILTILAQNGSALHRDIANSLGISSQALSWQMNQLKVAGVVNAEKVGVNVRYSLANADIGKLINSLSEQLKKINE
jgi:predicted transcriptional regulator